MKFVSIGSECMYKKYSLNLDNDIHILMLENIDTQ